MSPQFRKRLKGIGLTAALAAALLCVIGVIVWVERSPRGVADAAAPADLATLESIERSFNWIAESVKPAVVFIEAEQAPAAGAPEDQPGEMPYIIPPNMDPEQFPPWFREWFRDFYGPEGPEEDEGLGPRFRSPLDPGMPSPRLQPRAPRPRMPAVGQGSGVVIDPDGYIVTNNHVVGSAASIRVHLPSGETYPAEVLGTDKISDLAVIKIEPDRPLVAAKLGDSDAAKVGSWAMAIAF